MDSTTSLPGLLSQVLVAFAIEFDNEFESRFAKTWARSFRVSIVMWSNLMRFVRGDGTPVGELATLSCVPESAAATAVGGMERWGYISADHDPRHGVGTVRKGFGSARGVRSGTLIYPSMAGKLAKELWEPLSVEIEDRWKKRLGQQQIQNIRDALAKVLSNIELQMPHFLPVVSGDGLFANQKLETAASEPDDDLAALLSRVLLAFTLDHEREAEVSFPIGANTLRVLGDEGLPLNALPLATGTSKEAVSMSMNWLKRSGYAVEEPDPNARGKIGRLTTKGAESRAAHESRVEAVERMWEERFGKETISGLRSSLQHVLDQPGGEDGPLSAGLVTPPGGWRGTGRYKPLTAAFIESPRDALPHYPMVLHRGGWPDGS